MGTNKPRQPRFALRRDPKNTQSSQQHYGKKPMSSSQRVTKQTRSVVRTTWRSIASFSMSVKTAAQIQRAQALREQAEVRSSANRSPLKAYVGWRSLMNPLYCLYGFRTAVGLLSVFGVFMVFSSSSVVMISTTQKPWHQGLNQLLYCVLGLVGYGCVSYLGSSKLYQKLANLAFLCSVVLQFMTLVPGLRHEVNGNAGWISVGPITIQPAEITKLALCMWFPLLLAVCSRRYRLLRKWNAYGELLIRVVAMLLPVLLGKDLGTAMIIVFIVLSILFVSDFPRKYLAASITIAVCGVLAMVLVSSNRMRRIMAALNGCSGENDARGVCFQSIHAKYAIASGGLTGVGIGNSREKWNYLPYAHNDFIFAIIAEELGFIGASIVILLYVIIGWCLIVSALQIRNRYASFVLIGVATWIVVQGLVNILVVLGALPVMGVPMPFVSAGGSSLVMCLVASGVADSLMRLNPRIKEDFERLSSLRPSARNHVIADN